MRKTIRNIKGFSIALLPLVALVCLGCTAQATATPTLTPIPTADIEPWSADGVITAGEYSGNNHYTDYDIFWRNDEQFIYLGMTAKTTGWVAVGVQPGEKMKDADLIFGAVVAGQAIISDAFNPGDYGPHAADTELGGSGDILESAGREDAGYATIEFKRRLNTGDSFDHPLVSGSNKIIWSFGSSDDIESMHLKRGLGSIDLR